MTAFVPTRRFWPLWAATTLGAFADNTLRMATILAVLAAYGSGSQGIFSLPFGAGRFGSELVSISFTLPVLLFSVLSGQLADITPRHSLIRKLKIVELGLMAMAALFFALGSGPFLLATMFLMGTQSAFFSPVRNAVMPHFHPKEELIRANGYYNAGLFVAIIAGYGLGGHFVNQEGGRVIVSAMLVTTAALGMLSSFFVPEAPAPAAKKRINWNLPKVALTQYKHVWELKGVFYPMMGIGWFWFIGAAVLANLPAYVFGYLGGNDTSLSIVQALFAIGAGVGSIAAGIIGTRMTDSFKLAGIGVAGTIAGCAIIWLLTQFSDDSEAIFRVANIPLLLALCFTAASNGLFAVPLMAALQRRAPTEDRAKIMGTSNMTNGAMATLSALLLIPLRGFGTGADDVFLVLAGCQLALLIFMIRRRHAIGDAAQKMEDSADALPSTVSLKNSPNA